MRLELEDFSRRMMGEYQSIVQQNEGLMKKILEEEVQNFDFEGVIRERIRRELQDFVENASRREAQSLLSGYRDKLVEIVKLHFDAEFDKMTNRR